MRGSGHFPRGRATLRILGALLLVVGVLIAAFRYSPWPSALLIRVVFEQGGAQANAALAGDVPAGVVSDYGLSYDAGDPDALLDVHRPPEAADARRPLTTIVWLHGGGFVAGHRGEVANYARLLASGGYAVASVDYSLAPQARYPTPIHQIGRALAWLSSNADRYGLDRTRFVLAGDSAGAQLAAQVAALLASPGYAASLHFRTSFERRQLIAVILFCGPLDAAQMTGAPPSWFTRTVVWSYLGSREPDAAMVDGFSVVRHVDARFPPTFISVGDHDPLASQSYAMAEVLRGHGVRVDALFFDRKHGPGLPHEYQFDLTRLEAREALRRVRAFLATL